MLHQSTNVILSASSISVNTRRCLGLGQLLASRGGPARVRRSLRNSPSHHMIATLDGNDGGDERNLIVLIWGARFAGELGIPPALLHGVSFAHSDVLGLTWSTRTKGEYTAGCQRVSLCHRVHRYLPNQLHSLWFSHLSATTVSPAWGVTTSRASVPKRPTKAMHITDRKTPAMFTHQVDCVLNLLSTVFFLLFISSFLAAP